MPHVAAPGITPLSKQGALQALDDFERAFALPPGARVDDGATIAAVWHFIEAPLDLAQLWSCRLHLRHTRACHGLYAGAVLEYPRTPCLIRDAPPIAVDAFHDALWRATN
jgi:hypothetical protein